MKNDCQRARYVNPYTDFGFKKLFGTEMNKELLISFINDRPDLPEYRAPGRQGTGQESRVRCVFSEQIQAATGLSARDAYRQESCM